MPRDLSWFKTGIQYDAKFTGFKTNLKYKIPTRCWNKITIFCYTDDRQDAIAEVVRQAGLYGYSDVTVDHLARIG